MSIADKLEQKEKINLVLGDYFLKNTGMPSRNVLSNLFYMNFPIERKELIVDRNSFFNISQGFLDFGIGNRGILVNSIIQHYGGNSDRISKFKKFIFSNRVESIINLDYDVMLERYCGEYIDKISFQNPNVENSNKIRYYKCFGDVATPQELIVSGQDFKKFTVLSYYKKYISKLQKEFLDRKTIFLGCDLENSDLIEFFNFLLKDLDKEKLKQIYFITGEKEYSEKALEFLDRFNIEVLGDELHTFKEKNIDVEPDKKIEEIEPLESLEPLEISVENKEIELEEKMILEKDGKIVLKKGFRLETAPELQFNSLHLYKNPIKFNNIPETSEEKIIFKNDNPGIRLGEEQIFGIKLRMIACKMGRFLELKSREFKIKISVALNKDGSIYLEKDYLEYEIFSNLSLGRMKSVIEFFINFFSGVHLSINSDKINGELNLHNRLQMLKFQIMRESYSNYNFVSDNISLAEEKKFYNSSLSYYENYLLWSYLNGNKIETWGNLELDSSLTVGEYGEIVLEREHKIEFKVGNEILIERVTISDLKENSEITQLLKKRMKIDMEIRNV
ncbi:MAG: SIR2 family protein [Fusobacteriaceae bacterium]